MKLIDKLKTAAKIGTGVVAGSGAFLYSSNDEPVKHLAYDDFFKGDTVSVTESVKPEDKFSSIDKYFSGNVAIGDENTDKAKIHYERAKEYIKSGNIEDGIKEYDTAIQLRPNNATYLNDFGTVFLNLKEYDKAISLFKSSIEINDNIGAPYLNLGLTYWSKAKKENNKQLFIEAIDLYKKVIELEGEKSNKSGMAKNAISVINNKYLSKF